MFQLRRETKEALFPQVSSGLKCHPLMGPKWTPNEPCPQKRLDLTGAEPPLTSLRWNSHLSKELG